MVYASIFDQKKFFKLKVKKIRGVRRKNPLSTKRKML